MSCKTDAAIYTKLHENDAPSCIDTTDSSKILISPEMTHKHTDDYCISSQYHHFNSQDIVEKTSLSFSPSCQQETASRRRCRLITHLSLISGITFLVLAAVFKVESRLHVSTAIESDSCPVNCITTCYSNLPFYQESLDCDASDKQQCDVDCGNVGMNTAKTYSVLFIVSVALGGVFVLAQFASNCLRYCFLDYYSMNKKP